MDGVIGNSSSGLAEVPTFKKATINIGDRQKGRMQCESVINCNPKSEDITKAIEKSYSEEFKNVLSKVENPYGNGGAADSIINILKKIDLESLIKKEFYDVDFK